MQNSPKNFDRHIRVEQLIKEFVATYIQREANTDPMITITNVNTSSDYKKATIYFTTIPDGRENDALIFLKRNASDLRQFIKKKSNLKIIPHMDFMVDAGERNRQNIDEIARNIGSGKKT